MTAQTPLSTPDSLSGEIRRLGRILGEIIVKLEGRAIYDLEEKIRLLAKSSRSGNKDSQEELLVAVRNLTTAEASHMAMAFTVYFELVNLAEETHRVRLLRLRRRAYYQQPGSLPMRESIGAALRELKERQVPAETVQALLDKLNVELVFTAHPTESKRRTMLNKLQRLAQRLHNPVAFIDDEVTGIEDPLALEREITSLWLTDRSRVARPEVTDEVRTGLWYFDTTLWQTVPLLQDELERALAATYPSVQAPTRWLTFGSWMGGDRDGNPNVTPQVTAETMVLHRRLALEKVQVSLRALSRQLSVSSRLDGVSPQLQQVIEGEKQLDPHLRFIHDRYPYEPYRLALLSLRDRVLESQRSEKAQVLLQAELPKETKPPIRTPEVTELLDLISESLVTHRAALLADGELHRLRQQVTLYGLSLARLDVRQHSMRHETAMAELLQKTGLCESYAALMEEEKLSLLKNILSKPAPTLPTELTPETGDVVGSLQVLKRARELYGDEALGVYVISMTHALSDIIEVLVFLHFAGLALDIVPLFETLSDLEAAPGILHRMFDFAPYRSHLDARERRQMIMLGYSDSNKDCGYLTANWALYLAQENISAVCRQRKVEFTLFHGRGGSIARGGGPAAKAILAQPCGCYDAKIRVTEQGEVLSTRYHDPDLAFRIIEQMVYGVLLAAEAAQRDEPVPESWRTAMTEMSKLAYGAYEALVHKDPSFIEFWKHATPIEEIGGLKLGSRPTFRRATKSVEDLRAIPWVFSWMQSRFVFPGWYGLGSALDGFAEQGAAQAELLATMYKEWSFFRTMIDNAQLTLLKADMQIAFHYALLVPDEALRVRIFDNLAAEFSRTEHAILALTGQKALLEREPVLARSVQLRNPYIDPLNYIQIEMIRRLRALPEKGGPEAEAIRAVIELTINGVSGGLKNTG